MLIYDTENVLFKWAATHPKEKRSLKSWQINKRKKVSRIKKSLQKFNLILCSFKYGSTKFILWCLLIARSLKVRSWIIIERIRALSVSLTNEVIARSSLFHGMICSWLVSKGHNFPLLRVKLYCLLCFGVKNLMRIILDNIYFLLN